ncbi:type II toxin-antitoxin system HicB family antitoxin [Alcaligenaceae bacterium CGII-47]|nr:type II toxin-antitoxin system HicB family antitoxin [Alcaligenaceae bacterium CGII-47]
MRNTMIIDGQQAVIAYDPDIEMFRGEFIGLNGGADFYAADVAGLHREGEISLNVFLTECARLGIEPRKNFSGKFILRLAPKIHEAAAIAAAASGESLNQWVADAIREAADA